jgi:5-formyltetrahydrofolate cyclo-ligase
LTKSRDDSTILLSKRKLRKEILSRLKAVKSLEILKKSAVIRDRLFALEEFKRARCVIAYVSMPDEVDTHQLIDESIGMGKQIGVPVLTAAKGKKGKRDLIISQITDRIKQLEIGPYGIKQPKQSDIKPVPCKEMDLILVPGLAFDREGNRLGRGKGYYDRFLEKIPKTALTIGLCFDFQVAESVPKLPHDIPVRMLISDN